MLALFFYLISSFDCKIILKNVKFINVMKL